MTKLNIIRPFRFAHRGVDIRDYQPGEIETEDKELVQMALEEGWAVTDDRATQSKALGGAPSNKSFPGAPVVERPPRRNRRKRTKPNPGRS